MKRNLRNKIVYFFKVIMISILFAIAGCTCDDSKKVLPPNVVIKYINSKENGIGYKLFISLPEGYYLKGNHSYKGNYPVLYLLDPDVEFSMAENIARTLINFDVVKPFIIVGIGYKDQDLSKMDPPSFWDKWTLNRARDYIPFQVKSGVNDFEGGDAEYKGLAKHTGGSDKFKNFIENELIPYIDSNYRTTKVRAISGHSQAGLFAMWMLLNYPSMFNEYIILSPSLWVEKGELLTQAHKLNTTLELKAYFAVGSLEHDASGSMVDNVKLFYSALPKDQHFDSKLDVITDENHASMVPIGLTKGFKFLYEK